MRTILAASLLILLAAVACATETPEPVATTEPTATVASSLPTNTPFSPTAEPTATPEATNATMPSTPTPTPTVDEVTNTPTPTATPEPTAMPTPTATLETISISEAIAQGYTREEEPCSNRQQFPDLYSNVPHEELENGMCAFYYPPDDIATTEPTATPEPTNATRPITPTPTPTDTLTLKPPYSIVTRSQEYGYTIDIPDAWVEDEGEIRSIPGGTLSIHAVELAAGTTLEEFAESVRDNLRQEWWPSALLFEITSFEKRRAGDPESYSLEYRVQESTKYCVVDVVEMIVLASSLPGPTQGFRVHHRACDSELPGGLEETRIETLNSFRIVTQPAAYYTQFLDADGITIKATGKVDPRALRAATDVVDTMLAHARRDIRECLPNVGAGLAIIPKDEYVTTLPEFAYLKGKGDFTGRTYESFRIRGLGGVKGQPVTATSEENLLRLPGDSHAFVDVTIHEFAHAVQNLCFTQQDHAQLNGLYDEALQANPFPGAHAMADTHEFFAVFTTAYFDATDELGVGRNEVREILRTDLPKVFAFMERLYRAEAAQSDEAMSAEESS